jgi:hypothetical protein
VAKQVVIARSAGDHPLGLSNWDNSVLLSFRKDGSVSVFGYHRSGRPLDAALGRGRTRNQACLPRWIRSWS